MNKNDSARYYLIKVERIFRNTDDLNSLSITLSNLGQVELSKGKSELAEKIFLESIKLFRILNSKEEWVSALKNISVTFLSTQSYDSALAASLESYTIASTNGSLLRKKEALGQVTKSYEMLKAYDKAYFYSLKLMIVSDSLILSAEDDIEIVGSANSVRETYERLLMSNSNRKVSQY
ncbi:MAG: hypothetical protein AAGF85_18675 [Bacteroidota bacterium]